MRGLLKYAFLLAIAATGGYLVLAPEDEDVAPSSAQQQAATALLEPPPSAQTATQASPASIEEEALEYTVAKRVASLAGWREFLAAHPNGAHAQSARAEVTKWSGTKGASADGSAATAALPPPENEQSDGLFQSLESLAANAQSASAKVGQLLLASKALASRTLRGSTDASQDASPMSKPAPGVPAPSVGTDGAAGARLAALTPDRVCQHDEDRLAQLRNNPSRDEATRFANELGCEKLRPQLLGLIESLEPAPAAPDISSAASPGAQTGSVRAHPSARPADVASLASEETCKRDEERLAKLGTNPSGEEALRFVKELGCEKLLPQLQRLLHSRDFDASTPPTPSDSAHSNTLLGPTCGSERSALDHLRQEPSAEAAGLFWRDMQCEGLRPQVRLLLESLNVAPESVGSATAPGEREPRSATADTSTAIEDNPACQRETAELNRVRATPDLSDAKRFASEVTCGALKPQVARLLESLGE